jgi:hypothetical protein
MGGVSQKAIGDSHSGEPDFVLARLVRHGCGKSLPKRGGLRVRFPMHNADVHCGRHVVAAGGGKAAGVLALGVPDEIGDGRAESERDIQGVIHGDRAGWLGTDEAVIAKCHGHGRLR